MTWVMLLAAILPAVLLMLYIYIKDKYQREPWKQLLKGLLFGVISAFIALPGAWLFQWIGLAPYGDPTTTAEAFGNAFFGAAIPEECAKLLMLWLLVRKNKYFDEYVDGIVYAVAIGMGFAGFENILYVFGQGEGWIGVAAVRAVLSVPGHYMDAVVMGYFYAYCHFHKGKNYVRMSMTLIAPIILHGLFDYFLMEQQVINSTTLAGILVICFFAVFIIGQRYARKAIKRQLARDLETTVVKENSYSLDKIIW